MTTYTKNCGRLMSIQWIALFVGKFSGQRLISEKWQGLKLQYNCLVVVRQRVVNGRVW